MNICAFCLSGAGLISEPMPSYCQLDHYEQPSMQLESNVAIYIEEHESEYHL